MVLVVVVADGIVRARDGSKPVLLSSCPLGLRSATPSQMLSLSNNDN